jgi:hypothetical protein
MGTLCARSEGTLVFRLEPLSRSQHDAFAAVCQKLEQRASRLFGMRYIVQDRVALPQAK